MRFVLTMLLAACAVHAQDERTRIAVEAVLKLQGVDLEQNAKLKETVSKLLARTAGTAEFVKLVQHFKVPNQEEGLLAVAMKNPKSDFGVEAMRAVIASGKGDLIRKTIEGPEVEVARNCVEALGNSRTKEAPPLLASIVADEARDIAVRRDRKSVV